MFSGIVEAQSTIVETKIENQAHRIWVKRPHHFDDLKIGDSICTNGVCLTVEKFDSETLQFCLGFETLKIIEKTYGTWSRIPLNLERSLKFGDRVHGHLVTGHVDTTAQILKSESHGDVWFLHVQTPDFLKKYFWKKGSACINGVSLTVNNIENGTLEFCLIPETLQKTNLKYYRAGDFINIESDYLAKAYIHSQQGEACTQ